MGFSRGLWRCGVKGCGDDAAVSFVAVISTPGNRRQRVQGFSSAVRLCLADAKHLASGQIPEPVRAAIEAALKKATGER